MSIVSPRVSGVPAAPGVARGVAVILGPSALPPPRAIEEDEIAGEIEQLRAAVAAVSAELRALGSRLRDEGLPDEGRIFIAGAAMARDPDLSDAAVEAIRSSRIDAAAAISVAASTVAARISALDDELLRARATDVLDVGDRIARRLAGVEGADLPGPSVIVAVDLAPAVTATLPRERILGIALERSSPTAHAAILARAYGIPAVVGATGLVDAIRAAGPGADVAIDGGTGEVVVAPDDADRARFDTSAAATVAARARDAGEASLPAVTRDGVDVMLLANIGTPDEAADAVRLGARGVGLFRTEFLFLERSAPPSEDEQLDAYARVVEALRGQPLTIRLLDVGGDKPIPYLPMPAEDNPFLGVRALRLAEREPDLFLTQLRACSRAAASTGAQVRVMAPMVADAADVDELLALAARARDDLDRTGVPHAAVELGVMLEIPSAILAADSYLGRVSFASLGTNDLLQYTLAADRGNPALERYRDPLHPALLRLIAMAVEAAGRAGVGLSVCGEMAGDPVAAVALVGLGVRSLSMTPSSLPGVRRAIRTASAADLAAAARVACDDPTAAAARSRFEAPESR